MEIVNRHWDFSQGPETLWSRQSGQYVNKNQKEHAEVLSSSKG